MARFTTPGDIFTGRGCIGVLKELDGDKVTVFLPDNRTDISETVKVHLNGKLLQIIDAPSPKVSCIMDCAEKVREFSPDWIVAAGGCSLLDACKAIRYFACNPGKTFDDISYKKSSPAHRAAIPMVQIPLIAETITCVTPNGVIFDEVKGCPRFMNDYDIIPEISVLDPDLMIHRSSHETACAGMDALVDAMEAFVSIQRSQFSNALAKEAICMIADSLIQASSGDTEAEVTLFYANCLDSIAFCNAGLGIAHALAHATGPAFTEGLITHDAASLYLPYVIAFNSKTSMKDYAEIAMALNIPGGTPEERTKGLISYIIDLSRRIGFPSSLREAGVSRHAFVSQAESLAKAAAADPCLRENPRPAGISDMLKILSDAYEGTIDICQEEK